VGVVECLLQGRVGVEMEPAAGELNWCPAQPSA
jgi:hypothetical protein